MNTSLRFCLSIFAATLTSHSLRAETNPSLNVDAYQLSEALVISPELGFGGTADVGVGFAIGPLTRKQSMQHGRPSESISIPELRAFAINQDQQFRGFILSGDLRAGGRNILWPHGLLLGLGFVSGEATMPFGVLRVGYAVGTPASTSVGIVSNTPLATSTKPHWFPDWLLTFTWPITIGESMMSGVYSTPSRQITTEDLKSL